MLLITSAVVLFLFERVFAFEYSCSDPKDSGLGNKSLQKFYYDPVWNACFAFKYKGKGGNGNRFDSKSECDRCLMVDGPVCNGPGKAYGDPIIKPRTMNPPERCEDITCPKNYTCMRGFVGVYCCLNENSNAENQGYAETCPNGAKAGGIMKDYFMAVFAHSCKDLICDKGYKCQQVNKHFAKCCEAK
ncbi:hypothetical protein L596_012403 [Steinernema carpocapsae]|uniref:BPTI/Kunitz inhibitor domain-containing protein n=1 Tax=Steinernema carpocapsae TaxID=34508 RepID=A0A4U5NXC0_STECR|nr:hypothetical protein L596_012403 [Steinernema carpocapsae]